MRIKMSPEMVITIVILLEFQLSNLLKIKKKDVLQYIYTSGTTGKFQI